MRAASIVPFLFGVADRDRLPGTVLVRLLTDIGVSESASRTVLARLRTEGALRSIRHGRRTDYELAGLVADGFKRARDTGHPEVFGPGPGVQPWSGEFYGLLFSLPDDERAHRDRLRTAARLAGYAPLRPGLMISTWDGWPALSDTVAGLPESASVQTLTLRFAPDAARSAAAEAWRLPAVAANIRALAASLDRALGAETEPRTGAAALARYGELALPAYRFFVGIPQLPDELVPADWPMPALIGALARVREVVGRPAEEHVAAVLADAHP